MNYKVSRNIREKTQFCVFFCSFIDKLCESNYNNKKNVRKNVVCCVLLLSGMRINDVRANAEGKLWARAN